MEACSSWLGHQDPVYLDLGMRVCFSTMEGQFVMTVLVTTQHTLSAETWVSLALRVGEVDISTQEATKKDTELD